MKRIIKIKYGNTDINSIIEIEINAEINLDFNVICNIVNTIYYSKNKVQVFLNDTPIMFFDKAFNTEINSDALKELINEAVNKIEVDECVPVYVKPINNLYDSKVKEIKDEIPIYKAAEHGTNIDYKKEVPDIKYHSKV